MENTSTGFFHTIDERLELGSGYIEPERILARTGYLIGSLLGWPVAVIYYLFHIDELSDDTAYLFTTAVGTVLGRAFGYIGALIGIAVVLLFWVVMDAGTAIAYKNGLTRYPPTLFG